MIYLDYNATTPVDPAVVATVTETLQNAWGNPSSNHQAGKGSKKVRRVDVNGVKNGKDPSSSFCVIRSIHIF